MLNGPNEIYQRDTVIGARLYYLDDTYFVRVRGLGGENWPEKGPEVYGATRGIMMVCYLQRYYILVIFSFFYRVTMTYVSNMTEISPDLI